MSRQKLLAVDISFFAAVALVIAGLAIAYHNPFKRELVVWSCGGNYDGLLAFAQQFEKRHGCRVHYTAAPVEYLLERAVFGTTQPDILVGRAGPGWVALEKVGKVERGPSFFAADPYVIFVASGNPLNIRSLADLGRPGVRVAGARHAMRPKGKCAAHIMEVASRKFHPGLAERWENNMGALGELKCGRGLTEPVMTGRADAAIGYMSVASYPSVRGRVETVAIHPEYIKPMTSCKATVGQCICVLRGSRHSDLAHRFHDELVGEIGRPTLEQYGYIHISSPAIKPYRFLLREVQVPRRMPPWQVYLADCLAADGIHREALRRYLTVIHVFGPGEHDAYCQYRVGELLAEQGRVAEAAAQWRRLLEQFPRPAPQEYHNRAFDLVEIGPDVTDRPEPHWVARARVRLAQIPQADRKASRAALPSWVPAGALEPLVVTEGDPGKNGKRQVALGDDLLLAGDNEFALRDYLKVMTLCYPSRYMPAASFKLGLCQYMRGDPAAAGREWQQTVAQFPASEWAAYAQVALRHVPAPPAEPATRMPAWQPAYDTWPQRGMSYGLALYRHNLPRFAFKEMIKIIQGEYGPNPLTARARYQAGLAALESGELEAAVLQWRLCRQDYPTSPWSARSQASLDQLVAAGRLPAQALKAPLPAISHQNKPACRQRFNIAEEFFHAGFADDEETALEYLKTLTVTRASPGRYDETVVPAAEARLAQCLEERGHTERAAVHRLKAAQPRTPGGRRGRPRPGK